MNSEKSTKIILKDLPKVSLNKIYSGVHWKIRSKLKDDYKFLIKNQFKGVFCKDKIYNVDYIFYFKSSPLDASNTAFMAKLIEDVIFENDDYKVINKISLQSKQNSKEFIEITVNEIWNNGLF